MSYDPGIVEVPRVEPLPQDLYNLFKSIREAERSLPDAYLNVELRSSSFPLCPKAYHISRRLPQKRRLHKQEKFMLDASALMGTALHMVMQKWFAIMIPEAFYGNWKCATCHHTKHHTFGLPVCKHCGKEMLYSEYAIKKGPGLPYNGHIDGILKGFKGLNYLLDFKGSSQDHMRDLKASAHPAETHYCQANSYACAINEGLVKFGDLDHIDKLIILYVERGRPHKLWEPMVVSPSRKVWLKTRELIRVGNRSLKELVVPKGFCVTADDEPGRWCLWRSVCFSPLLESYLVDKVFPTSKFAKTSPSPLETLFHF